jgi:hypothetical protein
MRKTAIILGIVLVLAVTTVGVFRLLRSTQQTFNDTDLRPTRAQLAIGSNGFPLLLEAGKLLAVTELEESALSELRTGSSWDEGQARDFLKANEASLTTMRRAWLCPHLQVDAITNFDAEFPYLREWRKLTCLTLIEARSSFHGGNETEAFDMAMEVVRFGHRIEESGGGILHYLVGSAIKSQGLESLRRFADDTRLPADKLQSVTRQLKDFEANQDGLREALKVEYATQADMFDGFPSNVVTNSSGLPIAAPPFVYSATRSKAELAAQIRLTIAAMTNCYAIGMKAIPTAKTNVSPIWLLLRGNAVGTILNEMSLSSREKILARKCRENASLRATRTVLALRAFQMTNGRNPQSLEELLPDFLEAIPLDDYDGKPLRYSPSLKVVHSVGDNLTDDGGVQSTNRLKSADLVFPFNF